MEFKKIDQLNNLNSYSELYIVKNEVYKIYSKKNSLVDYNINNVRLLLNNKDKLKKIPELVLPNGLLEYNNEIVGFSMPYIKGLSLYEFINNNNTDDVCEVLTKIYIAMKKSNDLSINICDFHQDNVIIDSEKNVHLIDCDSFIIDGNKYVSDDMEYNGKYISIGKDNVPGFAFEKHNANSDYFSLFMTLLYYIDENNISDLYNGYLITNNNAINRLVNIKDVDMFDLNIYDLLDIAYDLKNIKFKEKNYIPPEEIDKEIKKIRKMYNLK